MRVFGIVLPEGEIQDHLALEHRLLELLDPDTGILLFYTNRAAVVWGKHQNPWYELPVDAMAEAGVAMVRRSSGGGTVYHDPGNLNYSFLLPRNHFRQDENLRLLADALRDLSIDPEISPRGDILVEGKKCSGNALWYQKDRVLHHGTLLVSADLGRLARGLQGLKCAADLKIEGNWVDSKPWPVMNLRNLVPALNGYHIIEAVFRRLGSAYAGPGDHLVANARLGSRLKEIAAQYGSWTWNFARGAAFQCSSEGPSPWRLEIEQGLIRTLTWQAGPGGTEVLSAPGTVPFFGVASLDCARSWMASPSGDLWERLAAAVPDGFYRED